MRTRILFALAWVFCFAYTGGVKAQRVSERLSRGVVALNKGSNKVYVSWRLLGTDPQNIAFNLYRATNGGAATKIASNVTASTNYLDASVNLTVPNSYFVKPIINGVEKAASETFTLAANTPVRRYLSIPMTPEPDAPLFTDPTTGAISDPYNVQAVWPGDVDGDGEWEYIVQRVYEGSVPPTTRHYKIDCYELNGTLKWRCNMGANAGFTANGTGFLVVADFDGDGKAEVITKTGEGTVFNYGASDSLRIGDTNTYGFGLDGITKYTVNVTGPEFLSVIDGQTGHEKTRTNFEPGNGWNPTTGTNGFDRYGPYERPSYIFMTVAYLDGVLPSVVIVRGAGGNNTPAFAFDYRGGQLTERWRWGNEYGTGPGLSQAHNIFASDIDNDGKDEILFLGSAIDDNGTTLYSNPDFTHGDHYRVQDMDQDKPGYEFFAIQQNNSSLVGMSINDALNGNYIYRWFMSNRGDLSRGDASDFDPRYKGAECFSTMAGVYTCTGEKTVDINRFPTRSIWWDDNLGREFLDGVNASNSSPAIERWSATNNRLDNRYYNIYSEGVGLPGTGGIPPFQGDIFGDWREELMLGTNNNRELRIYVSWDVTATRIYCLMQNPMYRMQNSTRGRMGGVSPDFYLGYGMQTPPPPPIVDAKLHWKGNTSNNKWDINTTANWLNKSTASKFAQGDTVLLDLTGINSVAINLTGTLTPGQVTVHSPVDYTFSGTGSLSGTMSLIKAGKSKLTINNKNTFTGETTVWDGALIENDTLKNSPVTVYGGTWGGLLSGGLTGGRIGGTGGFAAGATLNYGAAIVPGSGVGAAGKLTFSNLTENAGAVNFIDLSEDPTGVTKTNDLINVTGNLTLNDTVSVVIKQLGTKLSGGSYTLFQYGGTFSGDISKIRIVGCDLYPYTLTNSNGKISLVIATTRASASVTWSGVGNNWDLYKSTNWLRGTTADKFVSNDNVTFNQTGAANSTVNLEGNLFVSAMLVDGTSNYSFGGKGSIAGAGKLTKRGTGVLRLANDNTYTGGTIIEGGTLEVTTLSDGGEPSSIGASSADSSNLVLYGGTTLSHVGVPTSTKRLVSIKTGECSFNVISGSSMALLNRINGTGTFVKTGAGSVLLGEKNTYTGGTIIKEGTVILGSVEANMYGLGTGSVSLMGGSMEMIGVASSQTSAWNVVVPAGYSGGLTTDSRCTLSGTLTGAGTLNLKIPFIRADFRGNWSAFTGTINILGNDFRVGNTYGYANATINLAESGANIYNLTSSGTIKIGALSGISSTYISGSVWEIGSNNADATFAGTIKGYSVNKVGTGTWTLTSPNNTYTSATNVNAGKLMVCNTSGIGAGTGTLTVASGATLGGSGIIKNNVVLNAGAILEPGNNGIGTLTDSTNLVLTNGSVTQIDIDNATKTADTIKVVGSLTLGGTLSINTIGTAIFALGDNFKLFNASSYSGSFSAIVPATPGPALAWDLSSLTTNGTLKVKAAISSLPGVVEAENYDFGVDGVAYHDETPDNSGGEYRTDNIDIVSCTDNGGGYNIQTGQANEWMNYSVNVTTSGVYQMKIRIRSGYAGAKLRVEVDGANATGSISIPSNGWTNFFDLKTNLSLSQGNHVLKVFIESGTIHLNKYTFTRLTPQTITFNAIPSKCPGSANFTPDATSGSGLPVTFASSDTTIAVISGNEVVVRAIGTVNIIANQAGNDTYAPASASQTLNVIPSLAYVTNTAPGIIQAEDYDFGLEGNAYHDTNPLNYGGAYRTDGVDIATCTDVNGGYQVQSTAAGEWLKYTMNVNTTGDYQLNVRSRCGSTNTTFRVEIDGTDKTGALTIPNTGWGAWRDVKDTISLAAGSHIMRLYIISNISHFNWFEYTLLPGTRSASVIDNKDAIAGQLKVWPNPFHGTDIQVSFDLVNDSRVVLSVCDMLGRVVYMQSPGALKAGNITRSLSLQNLPIGSYLLRIQTNEGSKTVKLVHCR